MPLKFPFFDTAHPDENRSPSPKELPDLLRSEMDTGLRRYEWILKFGALFMVPFFIAACQADKTETDAPAAEITEAAKPEIPSLPLPEFPDYPAPVADLSDGQTGVIYFPAKSPYDFTRVLNNYDQSPDTTGKGTLVLPESANPDAPVPAMIIVHGSGGIAEGREFTYAKLFAENGIASFVLDYYEPRGVTEQTPYVMKTMATTEVDIMSDIYSALNVLGTHPAIDASRIGVTGYSYGGMGTRYVLDKRLKAIMALDVPPLALHMDIYGPCHQNTGSWITTGAPYLAIYGDQDNSVDPSACALVQEKLRAGGSAVKAHVIKGAGHAWENARPQGEFGGAYIRGCEFSYDKKTGAFLVDGKAGFTPSPEMNRAQRAAVRAGLGELAGGCVGQGYTVGSNPEADKESKAIQLAFMKKHFGLKSAPAPRSNPNPNPAPMSGPEGLYAFQSVAPNGAKSRTVLTQRRTAPSGHAVGTLQIDRADSTTVMDIAFDCKTDRYVYLHMDHNARPVDAAKIERVQRLSDQQLSAFETGEALRRLTFSNLDTLPPEDIGHYREILNKSCGR